MKNRERVALLYIDIIYSVYASSLPSMDWKGSGVTLVDKYEISMASQWK
jgi:hypothetical protein